MTRPYGATPLDGAQIRSVAAPEPPAWYLNLSENPEVEVQVKGDREIPVVVLERA